MGAFSSFIFLIHHEDFQLPLLSVEGLFSNSKPQTPRMVASPLGRPTLHENLVSYFTDHNSSLSLVPSSVLLAYCIKANPLYEVLYFKSKWGM